MLLYSQAENDAADSVKRVAFHSALPQIVYRPKVNARFESVVLDYRFAETHPRAWRLVGRACSPPGSLRPRVQRHPVSFAAYNLEVVFIVAVCITEKYGRKKKLWEKEDGSLRNLSLNPADARVYLRDGMTHSLYGARTAICRGKKIFISRIVGLLPKHVRGGEKVRKRYFSPLYLEIHSRDSREGCVIVAPGYRALMGGRSEKWILPPRDRWSIACRATSFRHNGEERSSSRFGLTIRAKIREQRGGYKGATLKSGLNEWTN